MPCLRLLFKQRRTVYIVPHQMCEKYFKLCSASSFLVLPSIPFEYHLPQNIGSFDTCKFVHIVNENRFKSQWGQLNSSISMGFMLQVHSGSLRTHIHTKIINKGRIQVELHLYYFKICTWRQLFRAEECNSFLEISLMCINSNQLSPVITIKYFIKSVINVYWPLH